MSQKSNKRVYVIHNRHSGKNHLVRAATPAQAISHITRSEYACKVAEQDDLIRLVAEGVKVEDTGGGE